MIRRASLDFALGGDAGAFDFLAGGDFSRLESLLLSDLQGVEMALAGEPQFVQRAGLGDPLGLGFLAGGNFRLLLDDIRRGNFERLGGERDLAFQFDEFQRLLRLDLEFVLLTLAFDAGFVQFEFERNLFAFGQLTRLELRFVECPAAGDFTALRVFLGADARFGDRTFLAETGLLDRLAGGQLGLLGFLVAERALLDEVGALGGLADFHLALLFKAGIFGLAIDFEDLALGVEVLGADIDQRPLLDLVAHAAAGFDRFRELRQALGIEGVGRIEDIRGSSGRDRQARPFPVQDRSRANASEASALTLRGIVIAQLVHFLERHLGGDGAHRAGEFAFQQFADAVDLHGAPAERLSGGGHQLLAGADADEEFGDDVDAHAVLGDQRRGRPGGAPRCA